MTPTPTEVRRPRLRDHRHEDDMLHLAQRTPEDVLQAAQRRAANAVLNAEHLGCLSDPTFSAAARGTHDGDSLTEGWTWTADQGWM